MTPWHAKWSQNYNGWGRGGGHGGGARANGRSGSGSQGSGKKYWACCIPGCVASLKAIGHRPRNNSPDAWQCGHCELPWNFVQVAVDVEFDKAKEELFATKAKGPDGMASLLSKAQSRRMTSDAAATTLVVLASLVKKKLQH